MKKLSYILTAALTFFLSATVYFVYLNFVVEDSKSSVKPLPSFPLISLCDATNNAELFKGKDLAIKANFYVNQSGQMQAFELKKACKGRFVDLNFWNDSGLLTERELSLDKKEILFQLSDKPPRKAFVEVEIIGEIEERERGTYCFGPSQFYLKAKDIKQTSQVKFINFEQELKTIDAELFDEEKKIEVIEQIKSSGLGRGRGFGSGSGQGTSKAIFE